MFRSKKMADILKHIMPNKLVIAITQEDGDHKPIFKIVKISRDVSTIKNFVAYYMGNRQYKNYLKTINNDKFLTLKGENI